MDKYTKEELDMMIKDFSILSDDEFYNKYNKDFTDEEMYDFIKKFPLYLNSINYNKEHNK